MFGLRVRTVWRSFAPESRQASRAPVHEGQAAVPDKGIRLDCLTAAQRWKYHGRLPGHHALLSGKSHVSSSAPPVRGHRPPFSVSSGAHSSSEERRVRNECCSTCRSRGAPYPTKKKKKKPQIH